MGEESDLELIPRIVRDKLDRAGIKLHLKQWQELRLDERRHLFELACGSASEVATWAAELDRVVLTRCEQKPDRLRGR